jgi:glycosyltransferase involved in cell wall biosynthesis
MKILFFIRSLVVGGSQRQLVLLAGGLARRGHNVVTAVFYTGGEIDVARADSGMRVVALDKSRRWDAVGPLARLRRLMLAEQPDVIYAFQPTQAVLATLVRPWRLPARLVFGVRASETDSRHYGFLSALASRLEGLLSHRADLIIANSQAGRADAIDRGLPENRIAVIPNGIDTCAMRPDAAAGLARRRAWGIAENAFVIGCVARLDPMKDHAGLLAAAAHFLRSDPDAVLVCVGDGPAAYRDRLVALAQSLGVAGRVIWAGELGNVGMAYNAFDIATLASAFGEGFPNVVGEAMACGVPVVATDVGDARAIVGRLGEVVAPRQPEQLSAGWERLRRRLALEPGLREATRRSMVVNFGVETMVGRTEDLLLRLLADRSRSA